MYKQGTPLYRSRYVHRKEKRQCRQSNTICMTLDIIKEMGYLSSTTTKFPESKEYYSYSSELISASPGNSKPKVCTVVIKILQMDAQKYSSPTPSKAQSRCMSFLHHGALFIVLSTACFHAQSYSSSFSKCFVHAPIPHRRALQIPQRINSTCNL